MTDRDSIGKNITKEQAQTEVAKILRDLELSTGSVVRSIDIQSIEVTNREDRGKRLSTRVEIELERLPGREWQL